jgi:UDP-galactopyranose mutase
MSNPLSALSLQSPHTLSVICFSHLRWRFVFQRPQHLLTRCAGDRRVYFFEEPVFDAETPWLERTVEPSGVVVALPHLPLGLAAEATSAQLKRLLDELIVTERIHEFVTWYYTPMALSYSRHLRPAATVYDCMDELSGFAGAPAGLREAEAELIHAADVIFTGGLSLYEAKRSLHPNVHAFPSSVDVAHFGRARRSKEDPPDQRAIGRPRLGFFGVIDERLDIELIRAAATARPRWEFVLIGPVVKIDPATLPRLANIHYLGSKDYSELPDYIAGWDVALLPFARNASTRFISPTKTPEYLAAGLPVVSTSIRDVVRPYGERGLVRIADTPGAFVEAAQAAMAQPRAERLTAADTFLSGMSWELTWKGMWRQVDLGLTRARLAGRASRSHVTGAATERVTPARA